MSGGNIFLNYRRSDTAGHAGRLFDRLERLFPGRVFRDVTGIPYGADFAEEIARRLDSCQALVVLIGRDWLTATDERGRRRLDDENDLLRLEIVTGLRSRARVIPVLVEGARMPTAEDLQADLKPLARRNALEITEPDFENDVARLARALAEALGVPPPAVAPQHAAYDATPHTTPHAPHAAGRRRVGLYFGLFAAGLGLFGLVVVAWLGLYFYSAAGDGADGRAPTSPPARAEAASSFNPVGVWEVAGVGTDLRSFIEMRADQTYVGAGTFRGVYGEGTGTWERGTDPNTIFFRTRLNDGGEVTARMEVRGEEAGVYSASHSYYGDLMMRRAAPR